MKRILSTIVIGTFLTSICATEARSAALVWFELEYSNPFALHVQGGPGRALVLDGLVEAGQTGDFEFRVQMFANVTDVGLFSANTTLTADYGVAMTSYTLAAPPSGAITPPANQGSYGPGEIASNFGGATFAGPGYLGERVYLGSMTFSVTPQHRSGYNAFKGLIYAQVGTGLWAQSNAQGTTIRFGHGAPADSAQIGAGLSPVIQFAPEPATAALLLVSAMPLLRRRRHLA